MPVRRRLADLIGSNQTFGTLASAGYTIRTHRSEYSLVRLTHVDHRHEPWFAASEFEFGLYAKSMAPLLAKVAGLPQAGPMPALHRRQVRLDTGQILSRQHMARGQQRHLSIYSSHIHRSCSNLMAALYHRECQPSLAMGTTGGTWHAAPAMTSRTALDIWNHCAISIHE